MKKVKDDWQEVRLGDICQINRGASPRPIQKYISDKGMPWVKISDATSSNSRYIKTTKEFIDLSGVSKSVKIDVGTLILSNSGTTGIPKIMGIEACVHDGWIIISNINKNVLKEFLYYEFLYVRNNISNLATGTVLQNLKTDIVKQFKINLPPLEEQKKIASILSSLDDKIEINNRMNKILEETAQTIFKEWFINFNFPNAKGKPYKNSGGKMIKSELGEIPEGWEVTTLEEICNIYSGYSYTSKDLSFSNDAMITIKNFERNGGLKLDGFKEIIISNKVKESHYANLYDVIVAHTDITQKADIIGNPILLLSKGKYNNLIISMDLVKVTFKNNDISNTVLYNILLNSNFKNHCLSYSSGTTVLHLSKKALPSYKLAFSNSEILKKLSNILEPIYQKIRVIYEENQKLASIRDSILPKLMSGEIRIK